MAPPNRPFPVSELEQRVHTRTVNFEEKSRKLPKGFNLKDCELFELVQYSCTTQQQQMEAAAKGSERSIQVECFPFKRLFRRCQHGDRTFHIETTAWEGPHGWKHNEEPPPSPQAKPVTKDDMFAHYGSYFWSKK